MENAPAETMKDAIATKKFGLDDLRPEDAELEINGKVYGLRKMNLTDEAWMKKFGDIQKLMNAEDVAFMSKLTFRLLKDKSDFLPVKEQDWDDDGNEITVTKTGPERILEGFSGPSQRFEWMKSLCVVFGISRPIFDGMIEDALKKNGLEDMIPTGEKSST